MKGNSAPADEKKQRAALTAAYRKADWARVITLTARGGGSARMVKRGS